MHLVIYQPDIPQNLGTMLRMAACTGVEVELVEPCGFVYDDKKVRRAGMDYIDHVTLRRHSSWQQFLQFKESHYPSSRLVLLTTKSPMPYTEFQFAPDDMLIVGRESAGVPDEVAAISNAQVVVPMRPPLRSLNVAIASAMVLGEALRQTLQKCNVE